MKQLGLWFSVNLPFQATATAVVDIQRMGSQPRRHASASRLAGDIGQRININLSLSISLSFSTLM